MVDGLAKVRQQFDQSPYPLNPLAMSPRGDINLLFLHTIVVPHYRRYGRVIDPRGAWILDVGCGTGYTTLILAEANPGAHIVGIDLSATSIEIARQRLDHHGFKQVEFHCLALEELPQLDQLFDYINCDETLYLLPDTRQGLVSMGQVLKPQGIIRANLHNVHNRQGYLRAQTLMTHLGLRDDTPGELECTIVREIMQELRPDVNLKALTWSNQEDALIKMNYFLENDQGFTIGQLFDLLESTNLAWIDMVDSARWQWAELFGEIPPAVQAFMENASVAQQLELFNLCNPVHRLFDFWCGHPQEIPQPDPRFWEGLTLEINPVFRDQALRTALDQAIQAGTPFAIRTFFEHNLPEGMHLSWMESILWRWVWEAPRSVQSLVEQWMQVHPIDPITLEPHPPDRIAQQVKQSLGVLHRYLFILGI